ncbi:fibroleukin-like [Clytia hemisphaerica]|uniref:Fibrinogen C-terminal domain-containing protein n=1 Tax=Clytia hemisphaerica TaxID=252671 RepID=A0A7M5VFZ4_9CNID
MALTGSRIFIFICIQWFAYTSATGNETVHVLVDRSISNLQKIKLKMKLLSQVKKMYGDCLPCRSISNSKSCDCTAIKPMEDCLEFLQNGYTKNGIYKVTQREKTVYCDQTTQNGGWTVFLRRQDGSTDFQQNWLDYKYGFGKLTSEFWLGNEIVHDLTKPSVAPKKSELLINMRMKGQTKLVFAKYDTFEIGDEASKYTLKISGVSGNAPHSTGSYSFLGNHNNMKFSTYDRDNDKDRSRHCSTEYGRVGWWFNRCYITLLTGNYKFTGHSNGEISWNNNPGDVEPKFVQMMMRRKL